MNIGNPELIDKHSRHPVPVMPRGVLNDYVPFYFTPFSPMLHNISTGWGGITRRPNEEIVILVSSLRHVAELGLCYLFTDSHAYYQWANFYSALDDLDKIDWRILQQRDFKRDADDPAKFERYQAEALIHNHLPVAALIGLFCYTEAVKQCIEQEVQTRQIKLPVYVRKE